MSRHEYLVPSALENPFSNEYRPKTNPTIALPVRSPERKRDKWIACRNLLNLVALAIAAHFCALFFEHSADVIPLLAVLAIPVVLIHMVFEQSLRLLPFCIAAVATLVLSCIIIYLPHGHTVLQALGLGLLLATAIQFRVHYIAMATGGMLDEATIHDFRHHHRLPKGLTPKSTIAGFFDAVVSFLTYNRSRVNVPGVLLSPAGGYFTRLAMMSLCIGTLASGFTVETLTLPGFPLVPPTNELLLFHVALRLLPNPLPIVPLWLLVCFVATASFVGKAYALKSKQMSSRHFRRFTHRMQNSPDATERDSLWLGLVSYDGSPILWPLRALLRHSWLCGKTGSGKTAYLSFLLDQLISSCRFSVIYIDMKADTNEVLACMTHSTERTSKERKQHIPLKHFGIILGESTHLFDIFSQRWWRHLGPDQKAGVVLSTLSLLYSRAYGQAWFTDASYDILFHVLQRHPDVRSFEELHRRIGEAMRFAPQWDLSDDVKEAGRHVQLVIKRLAYIPALNAAGHSQSIRDNAIDFTEAFQSPCHYYFGIGAIRDPLRAGDVARLVAGALLQTAAANKTRNTKTILVIDEFQEMVTKDLSQFLTMARGCGVGVILANQTASQLVTPDYDLTPIVEGNTSLQAWMQATDAVGRKQMRELGGEHIFQLQSVTRKAGPEETITTITKSDVIRDRVHSTLVSAIGSSPNRFLLRLTDNDGYACYRDLPFAAQKIFHQTESDYKKCVAMNWPPQTPATLVNTVPTLSNRPPRRPPPTP